MSNIKTEKLQLKLRNGSADINISPADFGTTGSGIYINSLFGTIPLNSAPIQVNQRFVVMVEEIASTVFDIELGQGGACCEIRVGQHTGTKGELNNVTFDEPFKSGTIPFVIKQNIGTSTANAGQQRAYTVQNVSNTGFTYYRPGDNNVTGIYYLAIAFYPNAVPSRN